MVAYLPLAACAPTPDSGEAPADPAPAPAAPAPADPAPADPAPWSAAPLPAGAVPGAYLEAWRDAENRAWCDLLALADPPPDPPAGPSAVGATARTARFAGGWGVAYDLPELRSAFGVAGTGVEPGPDTYDDWPYEREWRDGSRAGYGPEGGRGPNQLAYLRVAGQRCLYNVWSRLGRRHLEEVLESLRRVDLSQARGESYSLAVVSAESTYPSPDGPR